MSRTRGGRVRIGRNPGFNSRGYAQPGARKRNCDAYGIAVATGELLTTILPVGATATPSG